MPRYVDSLPTPAQPLEKRVVVLSAGRTGTKGCYHALKMLGYKPYHMNEAFIVRGVPHLKMLDEATAAHLGRGGKPYDKQDLDKLLADYDAVTDIPTQLADELVAAYPDAKFVLLTRDVDRWDYSMRQTLLPMAQRWDRFPYTLFQYFDPWLWTSFRMQKTFNLVLYGNQDIHDTEAAMANARSFYLDHNERVQKMVPKDKLLVCRLEDGFGWEQLCPFLGLDIPEEPYPRINSVDNFNEIQETVTNSMIRRGVLRMACWATPAIGVAAWYGLRYARRR